MTAEVGSVWTIGYEGRTIDDFVGHLVATGIDVLVDVRENAISRKPGFSKRALDSALATAGVRYEHLRSLGNPKSNRDAFRAGEAAARRRYVEHVNNGSRPDFDFLIDLCSSSRVALMCFEREHDTCHRSCLAEQLDREAALLTIPI